MGTEHPSTTTTEVLDESIQFRIEGGERWPRLPSPLTSHLSPSHLSLPGNTTTLSFPSLATAATPKK